MKKTNWCDAVPCTIHDHGGWLDRVNETMCPDNQHDYIIEKTLVEQINIHDSIQKQSFNYFLYCRKCGQVTGHGEIRKKIKF